MIAKIATDEAKPNGYLIIPPGSEEAFLAPLKVNKIPGVGEQTYRTLLEMGIEYIRDISAASTVVLENRLGRYGLELFQKAKGIHHGEVIAYHEAKSVSTENTFEENKADMDFLMRNCEDDLKGRKELRKTKNSRSHCCQDPNT
jgi:DNA polymerase-4